MIFSPESLKYGKKDITNQPNPGGYPKTYILEFEKKTFKLLI